MFRIARGLGVSRRYLPYQLSKIHNSSYVRPALHCLHFVEGTSLESDDIYHLLYGHSSCSCSIRTNASSFELQFYRAVEEECGANRFITTSTLVGPEEEVSATQTIEENAVEIGSLRKTF